MPFLQDIYECKTCGLTGSLCCCSECARVCHKGHNCKLKVTSPTAYCDCWEKCKCKALIAGNQSLRQELLNKLILETDLVKQSNSKYVFSLPITSRRYLAIARRPLFIILTISFIIYHRGENVLLFLVLTVGRQLIEQRQFTRRTRSTVVRKSNQTSETDPAMPEHDLDPPRFARKALERILNDWSAVKAMLMTGYNTGSEQPRYSQIHFPT